MKTNSWFVFILAMLGLRYAPRQTVPRTVWSNPASIHRSHSPSEKGPLAEAPFFAGGDGGIRTLDTL